MRRTLRALTGADTPSPSSYSTASRSPPSSSAFSRLDSSRKPQRRLSFASYASLPPLPLEDDTGSTASLPTAKDLFCIANKAWRGVEAHVYDPKRGLLVSGREIIQWYVKQAPRLYHSNLFVRVSRLISVPIYFSSFFPISNFSNTLTHLYAAVCSVTSTTLPRQRKKYDWKF